MPKENYEKLKKTYDKNGEIEFEAEIPVSVLEGHMSEAVGRAGENLTIAGFRKGKAPEHMVREYLGEMHILEDAADDALHEALREIAEDEKLALLGRPQLTIMKIAPGNPLAFKVRFARYPDVSLPNYKKIAEDIVARKDPLEVSEKDIDDSLDQVRKMMANAMSGHNHKPGEEGGNAEKEHEHPLPEVNDEFAQKLGPFKTVADLRAELKKQLMQEKEMSVKNLKRDETVKTIVDKAKMTVPKMLVDQELMVFREDRNQELQRAGLSLEEYLKQIGKTQEVLDKEEHALMEQQIKTSIVFGEIRKKENITPSERDIQIRIAQLKLRHPDRDEASLHDTAEAAAAQEALFEFLEKPAE